MPTTLHLGVADIPYGQTTLKSGRPSQSNKTTGEVADILERKYGVMQHFYDQYAPVISDALAQSMLDAFEAAQLGAPMSSFDVYGAATSDIEKMFKKFLYTKEMDALGVAGVPTAASLEGRSKRFKSGKGPAPRPSFIDTGLYETSFRAWVDNK